MKAPDNLLLLSDSSDAAPAMEFIDRYTIIEDAAVSDISAQTTRIDLIGPRATEVGASLVGQEIPQEMVVSGLIGRIAVDVVRYDWSKIPFISVIGPISEASAIWNAAVEAGAIPAGLHAFHTARVINGHTFPDAEQTDRFNPLELGLLPLVSFTKGCYIGQEVIARLDSYDKLQRRFMWMESDSPLRPGDKLSSVDGKRANVGEVTSVAPLKVAGRTLAMGFVRRGHWDWRSSLKCGEAEVVLTPEPVTWSA
jgi:folate-binding protein YgfZ